MSGDVLNELGITSITDPITSALSRDEESTPGLLSNYARQTKSSSHESQSRGILVVRALKCSGRASISDIHVLSVDGDIPGFSSRVHSKRPQRYLTSIREGALLHRETFRVSCVHTFR